MEENKDLELEQAQMEENVPADVEVEEQEQEVANEPEIEPVQENTEEPQTEEDAPEGAVEEVEQEPEEEAVHPDGDNDNKEDEKDGEGIPGEEVVTEPVEEKPSEEVTPKQAELLAQLEQLKAEKEIQQELKVCNEQVMKVEREFNAITADISQKLKHSFQANDIDPTKTLGELRKENPAKATLAEQFIQQAQKLRDDLERAATEEITKQQNKVIYKAAAIEFEKIGLNFDQAQDAVKMFKKIVNDIGVADLEEDLKMKVQLAAGRAMLLKPKTKEQGDTDTSVPADTDIPADTTDLNEASPEIEEKEVAEVQEEDKDVPPTPVVEKPKLEDFEEGVAGQASAGAGTMINELNVLEELAKLPYRERAKFYKEHEDTIARALSKRG